MHENIYKDIAERTNGDIYIGVVGPVRTGKSTFIKKFMDLMVIPNIENEYARERARDELPQSANGRTIMTTEPKFIPEDAVEIKVESNISLRVRLVDCVGYLVRGAMGHIENDTPRMVTTPWFEEQIPFNKAAEIGTRKVITEHSTIGIVVTTDGSFSEFLREDYVEAEERVIKELKEIDKPFVVVLNTQRPNEPETILLKQDLEEKYGVPVAPVNCAFMKVEDVSRIFGILLFEFPLSLLELNFPGWVGVLEHDHSFKQKLLGSLKNTFKSVRKIRHIESVLVDYEANEFINKTYLTNIYAGEGKITIDVVLKESEFYNVMSDLSGLKIDGERMLFRIVKEFSVVKKEYDKIKSAITQVNETGYGIVLPQIEELMLEEPQIIKQGGRYGVKLRASAPSIHHVGYKRMKIKFL